MKFVAVSVIAATAFVVYGQAGRATVSPQNAEVFANPDSGAPKTGTLAKGDTVVVQLKITGSSDGLSWCEVRAIAPSSVAGFVKCSDLTEAAKAVDPAPLPSVPRSALPEFAKGDVNELLKLSGMRQQIEQMADVRGIAKALVGRGVAQADADRVARAIERSLTPSSFVTPIRDAILANYSPEGIAGALEWYRSSSGQRVTRAGIDSASPAKVEQFTAFVQQRKTEALDPGRRALIERVADAFDFAKLQSTVVRSVMRGMAARLNAQLPPSNRLTEAKLDSLMQQVDAQSSNLKHLFVARLAFAYETVPDDDMRAYADFLESKPGQWSTACMMRGAAAAAQSLAAVMADEIMRAIPQRSRRTGDHG